MPHPSPSATTTAAAAVVTILCLLSTATAALNPGDTLIPQDTQAAGQHPPTPAEALAAISLPPELTATVFAAEPDVRQPIDIKVDDRGRVWVCEAYSYGEWARRGQDRLLILTDEDDDGVADRRHVFQTGFHHLSSVALGFGGVWVLDSPHLAFIPDRNGDDIPDGPPEILLDGWTTAAGHNVVSGLTWGPDGWLYGRHGITDPSRVGPPGTPEEERIFIEPGVWRFHPVTRHFEVVLKGMTNPWGLDWDADGEMFLSGNVNGHLWHGLPGALYERMFGAGSVAHDYERLTMIGERPHYAGTGNWQTDWLDTEVGRNPANDLGGGHSHCGLLIYQGTTWPRRFHGKFLMNNTHGRRVNEEAVTPHGAGYQSRHLGDPIRMGDPWFRGVSLVDTPHGDVLISDWSDHGECHDTDGVHRSSGRIYRLAARHRPLDATAPLARLPDLELATLQASPSEWHVRHARRLLQERAAQGKIISPAAMAQLHHLLKHDENPRTRLRALWSLHTLKALTSEELVAFSNSTTPAHRVWSVRLIAAHKSPAAAEIDRLLALARQEESPRVRLELASVCSRLPPDLAWELGTRLAKNEQPSPLLPSPAPDPTLDLVLWHVLEPHVVPRAPAAATLAQLTPFPKLRRFITRRLAAELDLQPAASALAQLLDAAAQNPDQPWAQDALSGAMTALQGRRQRPALPNWSSIAERLLASSSPLAREAAVALSLAFNDTSTLHQLRLTVQSPTATTSARLHALEGLRLASPDDLPAVLLSALGTPDLRLTALRALADHPDPGPARHALTLWSNLSPEEKTAALDALTTRLTTARFLLQSMAAGAVKPTDLTTSHARQLTALNDPDLDRSLATHWGDLQPPKEETAALVARYRSLLTAPTTTPPDLARGRTVFLAACGACHALFGEGGALGPDLTGGGRKDLDYILHNVLDPSAAVPNDYRMTVITLRDGRVLSGVIPTQNPATVTLQTPVERHLLERASIDKIETQPYSWMPEGIIQALPENDLRHLIAYLQSDGAP